MRDDGGIDSPLRLSHCNMRDDGKMVQDSPTKVKSLMLLSLVRVRSSRAMALHVKTETRDHNDVHDPGKGEVPELLLCSLKPKAHSDYALWNTVY